MLGQVISSYIMLGKVWSGYDKFFQVRKCNDMLVQVMLGYANLCQVTSCYVI